MTAQRTWSARGRIRFPLSQGIRSTAKAIAAAPSPTLDLSNPRNGLDEVAAKLLETVTVSVELAALPFGVTDAGEKVPVTPVGSPEIERLIALGNEPFTGASAMVYWPEAPRAIVCGLFVAAIEKSGTTAATPEPES